MSLIVWLFLGCGSKVHLIYKFVLNWVPTTPNTFSVLEDLSLGIVLSISVLSWVKIHSFNLKFPSSSKASISLASFVAFSFGGNTLYYVIHIHVFFDDLSRFGISIRSHFCCFS